MTAGGEPGVPRSTSTLRAPDPDRDYGDFPARIYQAGLCRSRAHGARSPWYFSSGSGRFDLESPRGTLNTASSREVAVQESLGTVLVGDPVIPASKIADRWVSELELPEVTSADFTEGSAFGVPPGDVAAPMEDGYAMTRAWAAAMEVAGFGGIESCSRCVTGQSPTCLYVFGDEGQHVLGETLGRETMRAVIETMVGYTVDSIPAFGSLIVDP